MTSLCLLLGGCGGGSGGSVSSGEGNPTFEDGSNGGLDEGGEKELVALGVDSVRYRITIENDWGVEDFPQGFPDDAHLSLIGGATHNMAVSFWEIGEPATRGIEDMAETGMIDIFLGDEVVPAIENGTADSQFSVRNYTDPKIDGVPGTTVFELQVNRAYPLVSLVTMLGPSPDWFVGVSGERLYDDTLGWLPELKINLPLMDGGTKTDVTPVMGGPDIIPGVAIGYVVYDTPTGTYQPSDVPQMVARLRFERIE
ncbi:spondin domain-containing protein [Granulosicoccus antarcticus]|nr:spondin domain-containing protein [Granulosicoccus antarcticus]